MHRIARVALCWSTVILVVGCTKSDQAVKDSAAGTMAAPAATPEPAAPATIALADVAGTWKVTTIPESGPDTAVTTSVLTAMPDTSGWSLELKSGSSAGRKVPLQVMAAGDSVVLKSGLYPSMRRKGKQVWTENFLRLQDGKLRGVTVAHYMNSGADSVLRLRTEGTKMP